MRRRPRDPGGPLSAPESPEAFEVGDEGAGKRLDAWLAAAAGLSRGEAQSLIERGLVTLEGAPAPKSRRLATGERVQLRRAAVSKAEDTSAPLAIGTEAGDTA